MKPLHALIVEDVETDAELLQANLQAQGYELDARVVSTESDFVTALENEPEVIFADYRLPAFSGLRALQILRSRGLDTPFILVSGTIGDELAVAAMQAGADDFVPKDKLAQLDITLNRVLDRARARTKLRFAQVEVERLAAIVESSNDAIISRSMDGIIQSWNAAAERLFGWTEQEAIGQSIAIIIPPGRRGKLDLAIQRTVAGEFVGAVECERLCKDGTRVDTSVTFSTIRDVGNTVIGMALIYRDITMQKRLADESRRKTELTQLMESMARTVNESTHPEEAMRQCLDHICVHGRWTIGRFARFDPHLQNGITHSSIWRTPVPDKYAELMARSAEDRHTRTRGRFIGQLLREKKPVWITDLSCLEDAGRLEWAATAGLRTAFAFPVIANDHVIAFLEFFAEDIRDPDQMLLENIGGLGSQLARLIERHRSESALQMSEARTRAILDTQPECVKVVSADGYPVEVNRAGLAMLEAEDIEQVRRHGLLNFVLPGQRTQFSEHFQKALAGESSILEFEMIGLKGTRRWMESHATRMLMPETGKEAAMLAVTRDITERKQAQERIAYLSQYDALTGLPNRAVFRDRLSIAIARAGRRNEHLGILLLDLDRFKQVNDGLGLEAGDELLRQVAKRLKNTLRDVDTIARLGSNEFALLAEGISGSENAAAIAEKLGKAFTEPFTVAGSEVLATASIGICMHPNDAGTEDPDQLIEHAETAMRQVKRDGGGNYQFFDAVPNVRRGQRLDMEMRLRQALSRGEFELHYQPKVQLQTGTISGAEALLRWHNPDLGSISPAQFIPVAEEIGLIVPIGEWVLRTACTQMGIWHAKGHILNIAVNLSPRQFRQKDLVGMVATALQETHFPPEHLELEITEGTAMANAEQASKVLRMLKGLGIKLSVDDFGTGYSSLAYLKRFPLDTLKIDRSFVIDVGCDASSEAIMCATIALAHSLKLKVVAEGVETVPQRDFLIAAGCNEMQGYLCSPALPAAEFSALLQKQR